MTKLLTSSVLLALLCGPALADSKTTQIDLAVQGGASPRKYALRIVEDSCSSVESKSPVSRDKVRVCMKPSANDLRLEIEWETHEGTRDLRQQSTIVASRGQSWDLTADGMKLSGTVR